MLFFSFLLNRLLHPLLHPLNGVFEGSQCKRDNERCSSSKGVCFTLLQRVYVHYLCIIVILLWMLFWICD
ncbi:hypothetical protein CsatB_029240 [Cannabis sativa]|uniref:Uncharacterized protein n=1 Tax=Cannabis sativa TaxID=3483 RepID=A0A803R5U0_CANSA